MYKWRALATDFDGTIAHDGVLDISVEKALLQLQEAGIHVILVTGRELRDLTALKINLRIFHLVVAENGAVLYDPQTESHQLLAPPPDPLLLGELRKLEVTPLSVGQCIIATLEPHEVAVLESIKNLGLELSITFNKGWVMILPPNINKASGLAAALQHMELNAEDVVGVGDAENDHAFLRQCGLAVAVANALPALKQSAHVVTAGEAGQGVIELVDQMLSGKLDALPLPPPKI